MQLNGFKHFNKQQIEKKSLEVLNDFQENFSDRKQATPLKLLVEKLAEKHPKVKYNFKTNLGFAANGDRILGCYVPNSWEILVDEALEDNPTKFNFVLGHELGHLVLHRHIITNCTNEDLLSDTDLNIGKNSKQKSDWDWMEWQANYFSGAILLPKDKLISILVRQQKAMGLNWKGRVFVDEQPVNRKDYYDILTSVGAYFQVSQTVVEIRLRQLELLDDQRVSNFMNNKNLMADILKNLKPE